MCGGRILRQTGASHVEPRAPSEPGLRILVEPNAHHLLNLGDVAMVEIAVDRLEELWPEATIEVITESPERLAIHCPRALPVPATGRERWFRDRYLTETLHRILTVRVSRSLVRAERIARRRRPSVAEVAIRLSGRLRGEPPTPLRLFLRSVHDADVLVVSGAGALTDDFAPLANTVLELLATAKEGGATTAFLGQGLGPLTDPRSLDLAREILPGVDVISLREGRSSEPLLDTLGVPKGAALVTGDDAVELAYRSRSDQPLQRGMGVSLRAARYSGLDEATLSRLRPILGQAIARHDARPVAIPISRVPAEADAAAIAHVLGDHKPESRAEETTTTSQVLERIGGCRVVVSGSYHAAVFALAQGVPAVALARSPYYVDKFLGLRGQFDGHLPVVSLGDPLLAERLGTAIESTWEGAHDVRPRLLAAAARQVEESRGAYRRLAEVVRTRGISPRGRPRRRPAPVAVSLPDVTPAFNLHQQDASTWEERAEVAVDLLVRRADELALPPRVGIADLGCGNERLRGVLERRYPGPHRYQGYDLRPQTATAAPIDIERELPRSDFDFVFCLGLLEYIEDLPWFLRRLTSRFPAAVISYAISDSPAPLSRRQRRARGWRTHHTRSQLRAELDRCGLVPRDFEVTNGGRTGLWLVVSAVRGVTPIRGGLDPKVHLGGAAPARDPDGRAA